MAVSTIMETLGHEGEPPSVTILPKTSVFSFLLPSLPAIGFPATSVTSPTNAEQAKSSGRFSP